MTRQRTLLFIGAHPDDETFGIGGTLAQYAVAGVRVYYACATRGEAGTVDPGQQMQGHATLGDMRWAELECAAQILGLADVIYLGYRDSGMPGAEDNKHQQALIKAPLKQVAARLVKAIRDLKPDVVVTFDPIGGYRHPDHIVVHNATVKAFHAAGDPGQYPEAGSAFRPQKLYFSVFPRGMLKVAVKVMPLFGQNPRRFGRNKDIDIASLAAIEFPVHAKVRLNKRSIELRDRAAACHASQMEGGPPRAGILGIINRLRSQRDLYMRGYPPVTGRRRESDLFEGVE